MLDRIFRNTMPGYKFTDFSVILHIVGVVAVEVGLMLVFQLWVRWETDFQQHTMPDGSVLTQRDCPKSHPGAVFLLYVYNAIVLLVAAVFAFRVRNVLSAFNENFFTVTAIGLITVITVVIVPVLYLITSAEASFLLLALGTFAATLLSTLIFAVPKLLMASGHLKYREAEAAFKSAVISGIITSLPNPETADDSSSGGGTFPREKKRSINSQVEKRLSTIEGSLPTKFYSNGRTNKSRSSKTSGVFEEGIQEDAI
ncbi:hypothetical protein HK097_011579 [Rhizophlyctis rosea]|uniref:G-protein coupled receptors family 3 profile domain-containing protein n=1 Tax=Rhizophlyctis rosea TaxID=64517 RepID=A0AAD5WZT2_9FUNG|nr:hypothetical protein HK097_011579 [Rhizophlyctis rosea]